VGIRTCWLAICPGSEFHMTRVALGGIGTQGSFQGFPQNASGDVGILDVAAIGNICINYVMLCYVIRHRMSSRGNFKTITFRDSSDTCVMLT